MAGTTDTGIPTVGAEKREPEVATVVPQDSPGERGKQGSRRRLGQYQRFLLGALIVLAFFGAVSMAAPKEAQAAGSDWYVTDIGGTNYNCWWTYHGTDANGEEVWSLDGCIAAYGSGGLPYYAEFSTGKAFVWVDQAWRDPSYLWRNSSFSNQIPYNSANLAALNYFMQQSRDAMVSNWLSISGSSLASFSVDSEAPIRGAEASTGLEAPSSGSSELSTTEVSTTEVSTTATFPWKVSQDDSGSMRYGKYAWRKVYSSKAQGGTYRISSSKTKGAFFAAQGATDAGGSTMKLITNTGPTMGKAKVLVVNLSTAKVVKTAYFDLRTSSRQYKVSKSITGLTPHQPYGLVVLSANGLPVAVDAIGYEAHGSMCHSTV